jgi:uncharacterized protein (TIGR02996 family)
MATLAEERAFLPPIVARFADDGPRLVFADYLDESDDPADRARGELIRVQCALARLSGDHPRRGELSHREGELLHRYQLVWSEHLSGLADGFEFRRGLLDAVSVDAVTFLASGDELFRRAPVRRVRLLDASRHVAKLADCPFLALVRELDLCGNDLGNGGVNVLLRSPFLTRLQELDLSFNGLCDGGAQLIACSAATPRLRALALSDNQRIGAAGVALLAESPHLAGLRALDVSGNDVGDAGVRSVTRSRFLTRLHTFRIHGNRIGDPGATELAGSPLLARMLAQRPRLDLRQNGIGPAGAQALAASPLLGRLVGLDLSGNDLGDVGAALLAGSEHLTGLRRLALRQNHIGDAGAAALATSGLMVRLAYLDVSANRLTQKGVDALWANRRDFQTVLETAGNFVSDGWLTESADADPTPPPHDLHEEVGRVLRRVLPGEAAAGRPAGATP